MPTMDDFIKKAEKLEQDQQFLEAGAIWERLVEVDRAVLAYKRGGKLERAARVLETAGRQVEAAGFYATAGQPARAASLYEGARAWPQAARAFLKANEREKAALAYERADQLEDAAKIYGSLGNFDKAAQLYESAGLTAQAQEIRSAHLPTPASAQPPVAQLATLLHDPNACVEETTIVSGLMTLLANGKVDDAARYYAQCREDVGYPLMAALAGNHALEKPLAQMLIAAKDFHKAAQVLDALGYADKAAILFERSDDWGAAAECYVKAENLNKAAAMYERAQNYAQAAELYRAAGAEELAAANLERCHSYFAAGDSYFKLGRLEKAIELLQKVPADAPEYVVATEMVSAALAKTGRRDLAIKRLVPLVKTLAVADSSAGVYYLLANLLAARGNAAPARQVYERLLAWRLDYRDVQARLDALGVATTPPSAVPPEPTATAAGVVTLMDGFDFLKATPLFAELSLEELRAVYHSAALRRFAPGETLIEQDRTGQALFVIREGSVAVKRVTAGSEHELARLGPGSPLGEMSLFDDTPTSARVVAVEPVAAFVIPRPSFHELMDRSEHVSLKVYRALVHTLTERLRQTTAKSIKPAASS